MGVGVGAGVSVGVGVAVGLRDGVGVGVTVPTRTMEIPSTVTVAKRLKRKVNQSNVAEGTGPTSNETVFQAEEAGQTTRLL